MARITWCNFDIVLYLQVLPEGAGRFTTVPELGALHHLQNLLDLFFPEKPLNDRSHSFLPDCREAGG